MLATYLSLLKKNIIYALLILAFVDCSNKKANYYLNQQFRSATFCFQVYANKNQPYNQFLEIKNIRSNERTTIALSKLPCFISGFENDTLKLQYFIFSNKAWDRGVDLINVESSRIVISANYQYYNGSILDSAFTSDSLSINKGDVLFFKKQKLLNRVRQNNLMFDGENFFHFRIEGTKRFSTLINMEKRKDVDDYFKLIECE